MSVEVLSCHVDERAAIKIRAVVFRPDGQKLSSFQLKEQCARGVGRSSGLRGASRGRELREILQFFRVFTLLPLSLRPKTVNR